MTEQFFLGRFSHCQYKYTCSTFVLWPTLNEFKKQNKTKYCMIAIEQFKNKNICALFPNIRK